MNEEQRQQAIEDWLDLIGLTDSLSYNGFLEEEEEELLDRIGNHLRLLLNIHNEPRIVYSQMTETYYFTNLYEIREAPDGSELIVTINKRPATEAELETFSPRGEEHHV